MSQTFAALLTLQCVERGELALSDPIGTWVPQAPDPQARVLQVLAHAATLGGPVFRYDPARFASLTGVIQGCYELPYRKVIAAEILDRLAMIDAIPGRDVLEAPAAVRELFDDGDLARYAANLNRMAIPYRVDRRGRATRSDPPPAGIDAAQGVIASARDLAQYDAGLDDETIVRRSTLETAWTSTAVNGVSTPMGLGWFVQYYEGERVVWHFGATPEGYSSLILKVPARRLTLILLANSDGLSVPFDLHEGDVTDSLFAWTFLRIFI
jgi:CubicO group peptidase (beta-lactamase class C family)